MSNNLWLEILEYARWSPSPHNVQPWKVKIVNENEAKLYYIADRLLPVEDHIGRFMTTGFGIFIEYLDIAAHGKGYKVEVSTKHNTFNYDHSEPQLFAQLTLKKTDEKPLFDPELIKKRRTSRLPYDNQKIPEKVLAELQDIAKKYDTSFTFSEEKNMLDFILQLNCDTIFYDLDDTATRNEIGSWLRYSASEANKKQDGLWAYCMTTPGALMYLFFHAKWIFNIPVISSLAKRFYLQSTSTQIVGWLNGPFKTFPDWLAAGRMFGQLWLCLTKHDIYLHPFGSTITNPQAHKRLQERFHVDESQNVMWLIMRLGHSEKPPRSLRLSLDDILL